MSSRTCSTQNELLLHSLYKFYEKKTNLDNIISVINGESKISLRIVDWFVTNFSKKHFVVFSIMENDERSRFKVYNDYKLKLKAYSKKRFDPFCRWERISFPYGDNKYVETTIGQLNFFRWCIENSILDYIETNYEDIEADMNTRNSSSKKKDYIEHEGKTRKKREELSISATKCIKKENVQIRVTFN